MCVAKLCTSEDSTVDDRFLPLAGYEDVINGLFCFPIRAVPGPVMDPLQGTRVSAMQTLVSLHRLNNRWSLSLVVLSMKMGPDTAGRVRSGAEVVALTVGGGVEVVGGSACMASCN